MSPPEVRPAAFTFDGADSPIFRGYSDGRTWNGFAIPLLPIDEAERLVRHLVGRGCYSRTESLVVMRSPHGCPDTILTPITIETVNGPRSLVECNLGLSITESPLHVALFPVGTRVITVKPIDRFPCFMAAAGLAGTIVECDAGYVAARMDERIDGADEWERICGADEWDNEIHWDANDDSIDWIGSDLARLKATLVVRYDVSTLTPSDLEGLIGKARSAGADDYPDVPVDSEIVMERAP